MRRRIVAASAVVLLAPILCGAQTAVPDDTLKTFNDRIGAYVEMHRRLEGPIPPLAASKDIDEVHRLMDALRAAIRSERGAQGQGYFFTAGVTLQFRKGIASCLTRQDLIEIAEDVVEHSPAGLPAPVVNEALPEDAPFIPIPPRLFSRVPALPAELRYVVLGTALLLWDHHANMVVDIAPRLFDPATYSMTDAARR